MDKIKRLFFMIAFLMTCSFAFAESSYDISEFYSVIKPTSGTKLSGDMIRSLTWNISCLQQRLTKANMWLR